MLNVLELTRIREFIDACEDKEIKALLNNMDFEYGQYIHIGSVEECSRYKTFCKMSVLDVIQFFDKCLRAQKDEIECLTRFHTAEVKRLKEETKKRGRKSEQKK